MMQLWNTLLSLVAVAVAVLARAVVRGQVLVGLAVCLSAQT
jgi:hypothetical protein